MTSLSKTEIMTKVKLAIGIKSKLPFELESIVKAWESGKSRFPATWRSLFNVLEHLHLEDLHHQIEEYLRGESYAPLVRLVL